MAGWSQHEDWKRIRRAALVAPEAMCFRGNGKQAGPNKEIRRAAAFLDECLAGYFSAGCTPAWPDSAFQLVTILRYGRLAGSTFPLNGSSTLTACLSSGGTPDRL